MKEYTEQELQLLKEGVEASEALQNPAFASAINNLSEWLTNIVMNTKAEESSKRELYYNMHYALKELIGILNQRVTIKQQFEAELVEEENT